MSNNKAKSISLLILAIFIQTSYSNDNIPEIFRDDYLDEPDRDESQIMKALRWLKEEALEDEPVKCTTDEHCHYKVNSYYMCVKDVCEHKPLWPLLPIEWLGSFLFAIIMLLSNVGGIGGGGIAIPMVQIFFGWSDLKKAIAISSFSIFISTLTRFFYNWKERHPEKSNMGSLDYGLSNVMMPLTLIGTQVGAFVYLLCPVLVINVLLTLLLVWLWIKSMMKAIDIVKAERKAEKAKA